MRGRGESGGAVLAPIKALIRAVYHIYPASGNNLDEEGLGTSNKDRMFRYTQSSYVLEMASRGCL